MYTVSSGAFKPLVNLFKMILQQQTSEYFNVISCDLQMQTRTVWREFLSSSLYSQYKLFPLLFCGDQEMFY